MTIFKKFQLTPELFEFCVNDREVSRALTLYGLYSDSLAGLYPVMEIVVKNMGGQKQLAKRGWTSVSEIDLFFHSANTTEHQPRHGTLNQPPVKPMTLDEARMLVEGLLMNWVASKSGISLVTE